MTASIAPRRAREIVEAIWRAGVARVEGYGAVKTALAARDFAPTHIAAVGKAATSMALAALDRHGDLPALIVTKYGHGDDRLDGFENSQIIEAAHPIPDENSLAGGAALLDFFENSGKDARLLFLVSGGASALAEALAGDRSLDELRRVNQAMLGEGIDIHQINEQRLSLSRIKGGRLLSRFAGKALRVLAISDVEGDALGVIGSGIGAIDDVRKKIDAAAEIIASNRLAREAAETEASRLWLPVAANEESLYGKVDEIAARIAAALKAGPPGVYIYGGEPVIELPDKPGLGGRNQALALTLAREIAGADELAVLVAGTDGTDGPTEAAGGYVTGRDWRRVDGGESALIAADSGTWLKRAGGCFTTGPTGTNVMDLVIALKR